MNSFIKIHDEWVQPTSFFKKENGIWTEITESAMWEYLSQRPIFYGGHLIHHSLSIGGTAQMTGESCSYSAIYDGHLNVTTAATWSIISGSTFATIEPNTGEITILSGASGSSVVIQATYSGITAEKSVVFTFQEGTTSETETEIVINESGETTITTTTTTTEADGTSITNASVQILDENGDTVGSQESVKTENPDGSFTGASINYDTEGNPTEGVNTSGDTSGNVNTQEVEYDASNTTDSLTFA